MRRLKKIFCVILALILLNTFTATYAFASDCTHSRIKRVGKKDATCTEDGNIAYRICLINDCILDINNNVIDISEVIIPATGHKEETIKGYEAGCNSDGLSDGKKCTVCGVVTEEQVKIPSEGHNEITETLEIKAPTCAENGESKVITYCDKCNETLSEETVVIPSTNEHKYEKEVDGTRVPSTCTKQGSAEMKCVCGDTVTINLPLDENAHSFGDWKVIKEATCIASGEEIRFCLNDNTHTEKREIISDSDAHSFSEWIITKNPTCTLEGEEYRVCANDASHKEIRKIPIKPDAHTITSRIENEVSASCGADGSYTVIVYCSVCGAETERQVVSIPATGNHNYTIEVEDTRIPSTCTEQGSVQMKCVCGEIKTVSLPVDKNNHSWSENGVVTKKSTCVSEGEITYSCKNNGCTGVDKRVLGIDAEAHKWDSGTVISSATCSSEGVVEYCCQYSSLHKRTEKAPKDNTVHKPSTEIRNSVDATCGKNGSYDTVTFCADCKTVLSSVTSVIPSTGEHNYVEEVAGTKVPPTCISDGSVTMKCSCGATKITKLSQDKNAHIPDSEGYDCILCGKELKCRHSWTTEKVVTKESSCIENGSKAIICTKCNEAKPGTAETIAAYGHDFVGEWKTVTNPTCQSEGVKIRVCRSCYDFETQSVKKLSHTDKDNNKICDNCNAVTDMSAFFPEKEEKPESDTSPCSCDCHKDGFAKVMFSIINFFQKLFGSNKVCQCGTKH